MLLLLLALLGRAGWSVAEKLEEEAPFCNHKHRSHPLAEQEDRMSLGHGPPTCLPPDFLCREAPLLLGVSVPPSQMQLLTDSQPRCSLGSSSCLSPDQPGGSVFCD